MYATAVSSDGICLKSNTFVLLRFTHPIIKFSLNFPMSINGSSNFLDAQPKTPG